MSNTSNPSFADTPWTHAYVRLANHCITCATCRAVDEEGANLGLTCGAADQLSEQYRQARRGGIVPTSPAQEVSECRSATRAKDRSH
ncbi:hypothetical protein ACPCBX_33935 [Streptomyces tuirus]|uniref:Uncharacterized protein n=1 Tax=Streptomyces tuirus TaxID=68278 RepID=A0A7G1NJS2_9ACTN|nr:hypothetical protein [Streptomyces tuirus]BCL21856.1 hypothetical protein GCM10017668_36990 [Streptomyces tuirus]